MLKDKIYTNNMEFTERIDLNASNWLLSQLSDDFLKQHLLDGEETRFNYTSVKKRLQNYKKNHGVEKVKYYKKDKFGILRDYGDGIQSLPTEFRGLICKEMTDVDMVNCHPILLFNLCLKHNIPCEYLKYYCENRSECLDKYTTKNQIISSMNASWNSKKVSAWMSTFDVEMKAIQKALIALPEYEQQKELAKQSNLKKKRNNLEGVFISNLVTTFEVQILHKCIEYCRFNKIEIGVLMYDGFMIYGEKPEGLLDVLSTLSLDLGFKMEFKYKDHDNSITIPEDWKPEDDKSMYETLKQKYEKDRCLAFIETNVTYSLKVNNKIHFYTPSEIQHHFETEFLDKDKKKPFFNEWIKDANRQTFKDVGMYPHDVECPDGILNLWEGFDAEKLPHSNADITPMLDHIRIILKTEENFNFFIMWLRNMFQYPSGQTIMVVLKSEEGVGKSTIMDFIANIMGNQHYYECQDVKEGLFGRFNDHLSGKVCININETDRREMMPFIEKLKSMITSPIISIEGKGKKKYEEHNKRHLIMTVNNDNPLPIREGSRRFWYVECCEDLIGNTEYFDNLYSFTSKKANQRAFYQYLMEVPVQRKITIKDIPITDDMRNMFEANRCPIDEYAETFIGKQTAHDNYDNYKEYMRINGLKYEISKKSFEMKFTKYMTKYGIIKTRPQEEGMRNTYYEKTCLLTA